jgi:hypothetical protein
MSTPVLRHSWFQSGLRFCGSCLVTVGCWALWLVLGVLLVALAYIALARELPVPGFVLRRIEAELARSGLVLSFGRAQFDPTGKVLLQDVRLRGTQFEDPLLTCRLLYVRHDFWSLLAGQTTPAEIQAEGAALFLPAMLSPSGTAEPVVSNLAVTLRREPPVWRIDQAAGRLGPLAFTLRGDFTPPRTAAAPIDLARLTSQFLQFARQLGTVTDRLAAFEDPSVEARLETAGIGVNRLSLLFTAAAARRPWNQPVNSGGLVAGTSVMLGGGPRIVPLHVAALDVEGPAGFHSDAVRATLRLETTPGRLAGRPVELQAAAATVDTPAGPVMGPLLRADLSHWPQLRTEIAALVDGEFLAAEVDAALQEQSARIHATGRAAPDLIRRVLTRHTPRAEPFFRFGDPVGFDARVELAPGWRFARLESRVDAGRLDSRGVPVTAARGRITIAGTSFLADDARAAVGEGQARGSYWMDFGTTDYRMLLNGRLHPVDISGWFRGDWWPNFWNRWFAFAPGASPAAEVDIQGRWKSPALSNNFVRAHARDARVWGGDFQAVDATLFVRPAFVHGLAAKGHRADGAQRLAGSFKRFGVPGSPDTDRFEFDFTTNADPAVLGRMLEGRADTVLASLRFSQPPAIHAWGALDGEGPVLTPDYQFTGQADAPLHYYGFPLESAIVKGTVRGDDVRLQDVTFAAAGGTGAGHAKLSGPDGNRRLAFDLYLNKAALGPTVHAVQEYIAARDGTPVPTGPEGKFVRTAAASQLDFTLTAEGDPASLASFKGDGHAALTGGELGEVHLFGLLSQVLNSLTLSFSSLKFNSARTSMRLEQGALFFPDLKVTGPSATIDARGRYVFTDNNLDFTARFKPYEQPGSLLAAAVSIVINPLTSILELKLNGPLGDPKWSVLVSPGPRASMAPPATPPPATAAPPPGG